MESLPAGDSYKDIEIKSFIFSITFVMIDRSVKNRFQKTIRQILKNPIEIIKKTKEYKLHGIGNILCTGEKRRHVFGEEGIRYY